jgi:hypothetical protein
MDEKIADNFFSSGKSASDFHYNEKKRADFLAKGEAEERVKRFGVYQKLSFKLVRKKTPTGDVPYMKVDRVVDLPELMRISEEYFLPIDSPNGRIFPRGKMEKDFANL